MTKRLLWAWCVIGSGALALASCRSDAESVDGAPFLTPDGGGGSGDCVTACAPSEVCRNGACRWNDASLASLSLSPPGELAFAPTTLEYTTEVAASTSSLLVTASVADPARASLRVNDTPVASGAQTSVPFADPSATIVVAVTAESGEERRYRVVVGRSAPRPLPPYVPSHIGEAERRTS